MISRDCEGWVGTAIFFLLWFMAGTIIGAVITTGIYERQMAGKDAEIRILYRQIDELEAKVEKLEPEVERGTASWYGPGFHGKMTASGTRFDMDGWTAASPYLPLGSFVRVTNENNGQSVMLKITDRGPYKGGRIIDVSRAAAHELGLLWPGTAIVKIESWK
ncbi:Endolytic peptidoglycan transglycosylase RlpA [Azospirillaceae bacterium]